MICIVKIESGEIKGWIIATDTHDARRKAGGALLNDLAEKLYRIEFPKPGKHDLGDGYTMLVD
jgi:hypothetical protein